jgi:hypothetical protein
MTDPAATDPAEPQPRDIALEQPTPEVLEHLEEISDPEDAPTDAQREATEYGGE